MERLIYNILLSGENRHPQHCKSVPALLVLKRITTVWASSLRFTISPDTASEPARHPARKFCASIPDRMNLAMELLCASKRQFHYRTCWSASADCLVVRNLIIRCGPVKCEDAAKGSCCMGKKNESTSLNDRSKLGKRRGLLFLSFHHLQYVKAEEWVPRGGISREKTQSLGFWVQPVQRAEALWVCVCWFDGGVSAQWSINECFLSLLITLNPISSHWRGLRGESLILPNNGIWVLSENLLQLSEFCLIWLLNS